MADRADPRREASSHPHAALPERVVGYADRFSARPREDIAFKVSAPRGNFEVEFVRLLGPSIAGRHDAESVGHASRHGGARQPSTTGSLLRVDHFPRLESFEIEIVIQPTRLDAVNRES